ncbi:hypothetical protein ABT282_08105 [Streptomyces sp. NPDC000927]|uniref:hypothetical protein n=1 Tax=Streptomyces sp. NPDC000927 TaxID=3154371 RepID=UPI003331994B
MQNDSSFQGVRDMLLRVISRLEDGEHTITSLVRGGVDGGEWYASSTFICNNGRPVASDSMNAVAEVARLALQSVDSGNLFLSSLDTLGFHYVRSWSLLAGEMIPMSAEETGRLHADVFGGTPVLPMHFAGCVDAYLVPGATD